VALPFEFSGEFMTRLYFDLDRNRIAEKFNNGQTPKEIADDFGTCLQTVVKILREEGLIPPAKKGKGGQEHVKEFTAQSEIK
jgi:hypothetical protein